MSIPDEEGASGAEDTAALTVTVHLRTAPMSAAARRQQSVLSTLRSLEAEGAIPHLEIERWSSQVTVPVPEGDSGDAGAIELFEELEATAREVGVRLEPFFETRDAVGGLLSSGPTNQQIIVFPVICLTVRRDGELTGLYPCWKDGVHHSVEDALGRLAGDGPIANL